VWDGNLRERNNPMPRWWLILFFLSIAYCYVYFFLYPALGHHRGVLGWSSADQYRQEVVQAQRQYGPVYAAYAGLSIEELAKNPKALSLGRSLFANNCINCHGSDARGMPVQGIDLPCPAQLRYGVTRRDVQTTLPRDARRHAGPWSALRSGVDGVATYVESLSGRTAPAESGSRPGSIRLVRGLPWGRWEGKSGGRCSQPDRRHLVVRRFRPRDPCVHSGRPPRENAGPSMAGK
jgi:cytochrome c oxidase cbb3-type subunit 3